jgi:hypothetical protein
MKINNIFKGYTIEDMGEQIHFIEIQSRQTKNKNAMFEIDI